MRVCYFGSYRSNYSRNKIMITGLRKAGVEVIECHQPLWHGIEDRVRAVEGGWLSPSFWLRVTRTYARLLRQYRQVGPYDLLVIGYPGQFDIFLGRIITWFNRKPLVWDVFMSIYLISVERGLNRHNAFIVRAIRLLESLALRLPSLLIQDTWEYKQWLVDTYHISPARIKLVPTGADDRIFQPQTGSEKKNNTFKVIYYGTFIPNHAVPTIIEAARLLSDYHHIVFELIGEGPDQDEAQRLARDYALQNVTFSGWLEQPELMDRVAGAELFLGAFGSTPQSLMTVHNKIYEGLAMRKAVLTGASPAVQESFQHGENIYLCERENPTDLADAILTLIDDPNLRHKLEENGYNLFHEKYSLQKIGVTFRKHLEATLV